ncbi:MAG TPA: threonine/serine exporter family protein, partial [Gemmatimonadales bacterium]|nr:threonine/serine exporter family protein [Gemmatimonadales bacterium]
LEDVLGLAARQLGVEAQFFSTPTSIFASFGTLERQRTYMIRVEPGDHDLGKLAKIDRIVVSVLNGAMSPSDGSEQIARVSAAPPTYGPWHMVGAFALTSGTVTRFLGGGPREILVGAILGLVIGLLSVTAVRYASMARVFEALASFSAAFLAGAISHVFPHSVFIATLAGLIVLVPGFTLTVAMTELSTRHLASGTARMSGAFMTFLGIAFGVALGNTLSEQLFGPSANLLPAASPTWLIPVVLLLAPLGFVVLLRAEPKDAPWIIVMGVVAFYASQLGAIIFGPELGSFIGAFAVGVGSNLLARFLDRPSQIYLVPGILLLVPGSVGFRSLAALMDREVVSGIETAFKMVVIAVSIVSGILIANVVTPRRRVG